MPAVRRPGELGARAHRERGNVTIHRTQDELYHYRGNSVPVGARVERSGGVGLYGRPLVPPNRDRLVCPGRCAGNRVKNSRVLVRRLPEYPLKGGEEWMTRKGACANKLYAGSSNCCGKESLP